MKTIKNIAVAIIVIAIAVITTFVLRRFFFSFDKKLTNEQKTIIEKYISDKNNSYLKEGMTFTSTHYFGSRFNDDKLEIYLWVMFSEYDTSDGKFEEHSSISVPYLIVVNTKDDKFELTSHETPKDGSEYKKSIKSMYPLTIRGQVSNFIKTKDYKKLLKEHEQLIQVYVDYSKESE